MGARAASQTESIRAAVANATGKAIDRIEALVGGLGPRHFLRALLAPDGSVIVRVDEEEDPAARPAGVPPEPPLHPLVSFLSAADVPVAASLLWDEAAGITVLEDVGDESLEAAVHRMGVGDPRVTALYREACRIPARLQALPPDPALPCFARRLDAALFAYKAEQTIEWALPTGRGRALDSAEAECVRRAFRRIGEEAMDAPQRLAHRDFKAANLHLHPRDGHLVMIDLQGAFQAPPEYDLVCLLRDSHVPLDPDLEWALFDEACALLPDAASPAEHRRRFDLLTLTRVGKDLARYRFAAETRGDRRYLPLLGNAARSLRAAAARAAAWHPEYAALCELVDALPEAAP